MYFPHYMNLQMLTLAFDNIRMSILYDIFGVTLTVNAYHLLKGLCTHTVCYGVF